MCLSTELGPKDKVINALWSRLRSSEAQIIQTCCLVTSLVVPTRSPRRWAAPSAPRSPWQPRPPAGSVTSPYRPLPVSPGPGAASERAHTGALCRSGRAPCSPWPVGAAWCCRPPAGCSPVADARRPRLLPSPDQSTSSALVATEKETEI